MDDGASRVAGNHLMVLTEENSEALVHKSVNPFSPKRQGKRPEEFRTHL